MVYTFHCAHSHLEMQLNDIIIVSGCLHYNRYRSDTTKNGQYRSKYLVSVHPYSKMNYYSMHTVPVMWPDLLLVLVHQSPDGGLRPEGS